MKETAAQSATAPEITGVNDPHSFSKPESAVMTHLFLELNVDFKEKKLTGTATIDFERRDSEDLILDTRDLNIFRVTDETGSKDLPYRLGNPVPFMGSALSISAPTGVKQVKVFYSTGPDAPALQWLDPSQTAGKKSPFLFTQSEAILARTWVPVQDSPGIRFTYDAVVHVPGGLMAVMSAENPKEKSADGNYSFHMPQRIPAYLLALAVGNFVFKAVDQRTGIYAEPVTIDKAVYEFAKMPEMVAAAEKLYGPYEWGQYDLIILPPSFPFGGMENPRITFCTPTILAGDRSLTTLVAHELAHSWSGNLVTNATWNDFWLNEGFTVYFENRIMELLYGKDFADMQRLLGQQDLKETVAELGDTSRDTQLKLDLKGRDPDDGMTDIAYEKGNSLLLVIENYTGRKAWDEFLRSYFQKHAFKTMDTEKFLEELKLQFFQDNKKAWDSLQIEKWVYKPGIPSNLPVIRSARFEYAEQQAKAWLQGTPASSLDVTRFSAFEWMHFLQQLSPTLKEEQLKELDETFHFTQSGNSEILFLWLQLCIRNNYHQSDPAIESFLIHVGRRKFVKPLFTELIKSPGGKAFAKRIYETARPNYHAITRQTIDELLNSNNN